VRGVHLARRACLHSHRASLMHPQAVDAAVGGVHVAGGGAGVGVIKLRRRLQRRLPLPLPAVKLRPNLAWHGSRKARVGQMLRHHECVSA